ncbi:MAG TPA: hypothetical protein DCO86_01295 [Spirochaetaceae bacterium]|nr:hypothetical protein [Spirochaetaceae bacterium]
MDKAELLSRPEFSDAHFHSLSPRYDEAGIEFERIYASLFRGIDCSASLADIHEIAPRISRHSNIFTTVGAGPWQASEAASNGFLDEIESTANAFLQNKQMIAIGETGLDYHYDYDRTLQKSLFARQVEISIAVRLPLILHIRDSFKDAFDILAAYGLDRQGIVHCFSGDKDEARMALDKGFYLSFGGSATYKGNGHIREALAFCPSDRILLETDSPWLSPEGKRRSVNTPMNVYDIGNYLSEWRNDGRDGSIFKESNRNIVSFLSQREDVCSQAK